MLKNGNFTFEIDNHFLNFPTFTANNMKKNTMRIWPFDQKAEKETLSLITSKWDYQNSIPRKNARIYTVWLKVSVEIHVNHSMLEYYSCFAIKYCNI